MCGARVGCVGALALPLRCPVPFAWPPAQSGGARCAARAVLRGAGHPWRRRAQGSALLPAPCSSLQRRVCQLGAPGQQPLGMLLRCAEAWSTPQAQASQKRLAALPLPLVTAGLRQQTQAAAV